MSLVRTGVYAVEARRSHPTGAHLRPGHFLRFRLPGADERSGCNCQMTVCGPIPRSSAKTKT